MRKGDLGSLALSPREEIDVRLAEIFLQTGLTGKPTLKAREQRDLEWLTGLASALHIPVDRSLVHAILAGKPNVSSPETVDQIQALVMILEEIIGQGEKNQLPDFEDLTELVRRCCQDQHLTIRSGPPQESLPQKTFKDAVELPGLLAQFNPDKGYLEGGHFFRESHPLDQAAMVFRRALRLSPFPRGNLCFAILTASAILLAAGFPPLVFIPEDRDDVAKWADGEACFPWSRLEYRVLGLLRLED